MKKFIYWICFLFVLLCCSPDFDASAAEEWLWPTEVSRMNTTWITQKYSTSHKALDIGGSHGTSPIYASKSGTVVARYDGCDCRSQCPDGTGTCEHGKTLGNYVVIDHGSGVYSRYIHLYNGGVAALGSVRQGDIIGYMGSTGRSTGVHLDFSIYTGGTGVSGGAILNGTAVNVTPANVYSDGNITYVTTPSISYTNPPTNVSLSTNKTLYAAAETITFTCAGTDASGYTIGIVKDGTRIFTGDINAVYETSFSEPGSYSAYITAWNSVGTTDSQWISFSVYNSAPTNVSISANKSSFSINETITFTCAATNATGYTIGITKDGARIFTGDINAVYETSFSEPGNYAAYITAWNSAGGTDSQWITFPVYGSAPTNPWIKIDRYNSAINSDVCFTYYANNAESYELWLFRDGLCIGATSVGASGSYTTNFDTAGYYQAYISCSNFSGYIDSSKIEFNIYGNVPPDPWIYAEENTVQVNENVTFVYNASTVTYFDLGFDRYGERVHSVRREWHETTYTISFDKPGTYTAYISAYNDYGYADSRKVTFTVHDKAIADIGEVFYGKLLNKASWKPVKNDNGVLALNKEMGLADELWKFIKQADGSYEIISCLNGEHLMAKSNANNTLSQVVIGNSVEPNQKQWYAYEYNGGMILKPKCSEYVFDLENGTETDGSKVALKPLSGEASQIFSVYREDDVQLSAPVLTISGTDYGQIEIQWSAVGSLAKYKIKVFASDNADEPIYVDDVDAVFTSYKLTLPRGSYTATVTAYNYFEGMESNVISFDIVVPIFVTVSKNDTQLSFQCIFNLKDAEGAMVLLGAYDESGNLLASEIAAYDTNITLDIAYQDKLHHAKILVWSGLTPKHDAEVIPKSEWGSE